MLEDSSDLVVHALRKLGFIDDGFNANVPEAMLLFINLTENKKNVRKFGVLPGPGDNHRDVARMLRTLFLSHEAPSLWQIMDISKGAMERVLNILKTAKVLSGDTLQLSNEEMIQAMQIYAKQQQLPCMETLNGMVFVILRHSAEDPSKRPIVDFDR